MHRPGVSTPGLLHIMALVKKPALEVQVAAKTTNMKTNYAMKYFFLGVLFVIGLIVFCQLVTSCTSTKQGCYDFSKQQTTKFNK